MSFKLFLATVIIGSILSWIGLFLVVTNTDPTTTDGATLLFYSTLALALFGTVTAIGLSFRRLFIKDHDALLRHLKQSVRQSILITIGILTILKLMSADLFTWWLSLLIILLIILIEAIFYSRRTAVSGYVQ